ncbi:unnamed protein product [Trifolium pratense]|uniref:Uncharacterized protein n=1 Tax=Trifolium pratense TaxID=57577 RepID=A0ACB0JTX6_TRIPR|nr:unnamed protein product [Trifolium pratense]
MALEEGKVKIERFDGRDFSFWKMQIEDYLYQKKLYQPLSGKKPDDMKQEDWVLLDRQALGVIRLTLAKNVAFNIVNETTTAGLIKALSDMYEKPSAANKVYLMRRLFNLKMGEGISITNHINEFNTILSQLESVQIKFEDEVKALILLSSLPDSWDATVTAVSSSTGDNTLKLNDIRNLILSEDVRKRASGESSSHVSNSALNTESRGRTTQKSQNGRGRSKSRGKGQTKFRSDIVCWNCDKIGHFTNQCKAPKKNKSHRNKKHDDDESANAATDEFDDALICSLDSPVDSWVMDSGASFHTTPCKELLSNYVFGRFGKVYLADGKPLDIVGRGNIDIRTSSGTLWTLHNVTKGNLVVARGKKQGSLYMVADEDMIAVTEVVNNSSLWHQRLGHMSEKGMKLMATKGKLSNLKHVDVGVCEHCIFGKQKKVSFSRTGKNSKVEKLELVHTDVWGPAPVKSIGGSCYYITFIDDSTRKVWVYFLKNKSDVFSVFKRWKVEVENQTGLKIKSLKSDNGGEYDSQEFKDFCSEHGIRMIKTIPGTPEQNGVAERMNRTLNERARCIRIQSGLPKVFWAEAINTAAYLINRGPSVPLNYQLPEEVWSGKEVKLSHLRIFGCVSYILIDSCNRDKLDPKARKCYFIGYGSDMYGYRFWDDQNKKIIRSRNVTFNENLFYKDRLSAESVGASKVPELPEKATLEEISESDTAIKSQNTGIEVESESEPSTPPRRSSRTSVPPDRYSPSLHYLLLTDAGEPECFSEAMQGNDSIKWELAMKDEMTSLEKNGTWSLTKLPKEKKALHNRWVYRLKEESDGSRRYKARLVVKGFQQKQGIDFTEIFSPVVKMTTIRVILSIVAAENLHLEQLDVKTAFLHGDLEEDIYMTQPEGFEVPGKENLVCKLNKSLYGLKQAPRQWYKKFNEFMRSNMAEINRLKQKLAENFEMKDLGPAKQILGMRILRNRSEGTLKLSQEKYIHKLLDRFSLEDAKTRNTPLGSHLKFSKNQSSQIDEEKCYMSKVPYASAVGSLMYAMVCTRPDIAHAVGVVSRFLSNPAKEHWEGVKWILRYLKGTSEMCLCFRKGNISLQGFSDADLGGDLDTRKSTTGYIFTLGGTAVSWKSKLQHSVALSTTEAEYIAISEAAKEMIWLQNFLKELGKEQDDAPLFSDSQSALSLAKNPVFHSRCKHIQLKYHFIRELINDGELSLLKISGSENPADMLTKTVTTDKLRLCITSAGLRG